MGIENDEHCGAMLLTVVRLAMLPAVGIENDDHCGIVYTVSYSRGPNQQWESRTMNAAGACTWWGIPAMTCQRCDSRLRNTAGT